MSSLGLPGPHIACMVLGVVFVAALSGAGDAYAQIPAEHVNGGLFIYDTEDVNRKCTDFQSGSGPMFTISLGADGLDVSLALTTEQRRGDINIVHFEIKSQSTGDNIGIFNYTKSGDTYSFVVPTEALDFISSESDLADDTFGVRAIRDLLTLQPNSEAAKYIANPNVDIDAYRTFTHRSTFITTPFAILTNGDTDTLVKNSGNPVTTALATTHAIDTSQRSSPCILYGDVPGGDDSDPVIILTGYSKYFVEQGGTFEDPGAKCYDDKTDTQDIMGTPGSGTITTTTLGGSQTLEYRCQDLAGNFAGNAQVGDTSNLIIRHIVVHDKSDTTRPVIELYRTDDERRRGLVTTNYVESGATCVDDVEGHLPISNVIYRINIAPDDPQPNVVDSDKPSTGWRAVYECADSDGTRATDVERHIILSATGPYAYLFGANPLRIGQNDPLPKLGGACGEASSNPAPPVETPAISSATVATTTHTFACLSTPPITLTRTVIVTADTPDLPPDNHPQIQLAGDAYVELAKDAPYTERGARCGDAEDGNLPVTQIGDTVDISADDVYIQIYSCEDSDGNLARVFRTVKVDSTPPIIMIEDQQLNHDQVGMFEHPTCADMSGDALVPVAEENLTFTYEHNYLGELTLAEVMELFPKLAGNTTINVTCSDEASLVSMATEVLTITGANAPGPEILHKKYVRDGVKIDGTRDITPIDQGEFYDDPGASCLFQDNGGKDIMVTGDRIRPQGPEAQEVGYECTDDEGDSQGTTRSVRLVIVKEMVPPTTRAIFYIGDNAFFGEEEIRQRVGSTLRGMLHCTEADGVTPIESLVRGAVYSLGELEFTLNVTIPISGEMPVDDFVKGAKVGTYELQLICEHQVERVAVVILIITPNSGGGGDDWQLNPTFGRSWESDAQVVKGGFSFNGRTFDVTDNYHVDFERTTSVIGETNTVTIKVYSEMLLDTISLALGVPELSRVSDAESEIYVRVQSNYENENEYDIVDIVHEQGEDLVDPAGTSVSVQKSKCSPATELVCHEFTIQFRIMAPLMSDVLAISAMDLDRRITTTYVNDGVDFTGESMLDAETATIHLKHGNQHPVETIHLTQQDRRYNLWSDQYGFVWLQNPYGSWFQLTQAGFERIQDTHVSVMTRTHSVFADLVEHERQKAKLVFDADSIKSEVGESFSRAAPVKVEKLQDPEVLAKLKIEETKALRYLESYR